MIPVAKLFLLDEGILANVRSWAYRSLSSPFKNMPQNRVIKPSETSDNKIQTSEEIHYRLTPPPAKKRPEKGVELGMRGIKQKKIFTK